MSLLHFSANDQALRETKWNRVERSATKLGASYVQLRSTLFHLLPPSYNLVQEPNVGNLVELGLTNLLDFLPCRKIKCNMAKKKINVQGQEISISIVNNQDYFSLTDMARKFGDRPDELIRGWIRNRNTLEYLETWEQLYNKNFNSGQMAGFKENSGLNTWRPTVRQFIDETGAIGIQATPGRYGGTFAHKDIAFNFATWLSAPFQLYMVHEFDRLKAEDAKRLNKPWNLRRELSKLNYAIHTEAVRESLPIMIQRTKKESGYFASEADLLNEIVFGMTATVAGG